MHSNGGRVEQGCVEQGPMEIPLAYDLIPAEDRGRRVLPIIVSFSFPSPHLDVTIHDLTISFYFIPSYTPLSLFSAVIIRRTTPWTYAFFRAFFLAPSPCIPLPHQYIYIYISRRDMYVFSPCIAIVLTLFRREINSRRETFIHYLPGAKLEGN